MLPAQKRPCRSVLPSVESVSSRSGSGSAMGVAMPVAASKKWKPVLSARQDRHVPQRALAEDRARLQLQADVDHAASTSVASVTTARRVSAGSRTRMPVLARPAAARLKASVTWLTGSAQKNDRPAGV